MKNVFLLAFLLTAACSASAKSTICKVDDEVFITALAFNDDRSASYTDPSGKKHEGRVTARRPHFGGEKTNILFMLEEPRFGADAMEFVLFPAGAEYRVIGVGYKRLDGKLTLDIFAGNNKASCAAL